MRFIDEARVFVHAGKGGDGAIAFLREKYRPFGGPAGGDGGKGGDVILEVDEGMSTLLDFKYKPRLVARNGEPGRNKEQSGHAGSDLNVKVPPGTVAADEESGKVLADLVLPGTRAIIAHGGEGGRGNIHFVSSTRQAPRIATSGKPGEERWVRLELKLVAEVGLVGLPNAGKSTLLAALSAARPKIADYPFTTLSPNLGRLTISTEESCTIADIPGLIEGAHLGHGLGIRFLRHLSRTRILVFVVDVTTYVQQDFRVVREELKAFDPGLIKRPALIGLNKADLASADDAAEIAAQMRKKTKLPVFVISAEKKTGLKPLIKEIFEKLE